jgi:endoglucanase Acf2
MLRGILLCLCVSIGLMQPVFAQGVKVGEAEYFLAPKGSEKLPPDAPHRTAALMAQAAPTNQWYSTLIFNAKPEAIYAQPLTVKAVAPAFEVALPSKKVVPTFRRDVEIHYPHEEPLVFRPAAFAPDSSKLAKFSDWSIDVDMSAGADSMIATVSHGSPYVFFQLSRGDIQVALPAGASRVAGVGLSNQLVVDHKGKRYVVFAPAGASWEAGAAGAWVGKLPQGKGYFTAAALPDDKAATLELFARHAYAFVQDTRVTWQYDQVNSTVETLFSATTKAMEGSNTNTIMGLYPHHWHQNPLVADRLGAAYDTVRGQLKTLVGNEFKTRRQYLGWVPFWPAVGAVQGAPDLKDVMAIDVRNAGRMMREGGDFPYWRGKGIMRVINMMNIADQQGDAAARDRLLTLAKNEVEEWFAGKDRKTYFQYDAKLGTMLSHPEQFFVITFTIRIGSVRQQKSHCVTRIGQRNRSGEAWSISW